MPRYSSGPQTERERNQKKASSKGTLFDIANVASGGKLGLTKRVFGFMTSGGGSKGFRNTRRMGGGLPKKIKKK